jgi:hypothetical protein
MKSDLLFWILMLFGLVFWGCGFRYPQEAWARGGGWILIFVLFLVLGWKVFGPPLHQ